MAAKQNLLRRFSLLHIDTNETDLYDYWGSILGRWYILTRRKAVEL